MTDSLLGNKTHTWKRTRTHKQIDGTEETTEGKEQPGTREDGETDGNMGRMRKRGTLHLMVPLGSTQ